MQEHLASFPRPLPIQPPTKKLKTKKPAAKNAPRFDLSSELQRVTGVDLTRIDGIDVMVAQTLLSEVGLDMSRWRTESHFASWLGRCPDNRITGDKVLSRGTRRVARLVYRMLKYGQTYLDKGTEYYAERFRQQQIQLLRKRAAKLGLQVAEIHA